MENSENTVPPVPFWFDHVPLDDQVGLLVDPEQELSAELVERLSKHVAVSTAANFTTHENTGPFVLRGEDIEGLKFVRDRLAEWWETLDDDKRKGCLDHRHGVVPEQFRTLSAHIVGNRDHAIFVFSTPAKAFLEIQARQAA